MKRLQSPITMRIRKKDNSRRQQFSHLQLLIVILKVADGCVSIDDHFWKWTLHCRVAVAVRVGMINTRRRQSIKRIFR